MPVKRSAERAATAVTRSNSMLRPLTISVCIELTTFTADGFRGAMELCLQGSTFLDGAPRFHAENVHVSLGIPNEHFLHHRRRRLFRAARLNKIFGGLRVWPDER
jgi:hypothetical protein